MAINRLRLRDTMINRGIAAEAPAMEFADVLDEEIDGVLSGFATKGDLLAMEDRLKGYISEQISHQLRWTFGIAAGIAGTAVAIIGIIIAVT